MSLPDMIRYGSQAKIKIKIKPSSNSLLWHTLAEFVIMQRIPLILSDVKLHIGGGGRCST